jgi:hypothetical protein
MSGRKIEAQRIEVFVNKENEERISKGLLGTRTQTPSSSPDLFSCYKMQRRTNEICEVCPKILSHYRGSSHAFSPTSVQLKRVVAPRVSA